MSLLQKGSLWARLKPLSVQRQPCCLLPQTVSGGDQPCPAASKSAGCIGETASGTSRLTRWNRSAFQRRPKPIFADQDLFSQWLDDECEVDIRNRLKWDTIAALYSSWALYATNAGEEPGTVKAFGPSMLRKGLESKRTKMARAFPVSA